MKILGLDSSGLVAGVALAEDYVLLAEYNVNYKKTHSQTLLPMLAEIMKMLELAPDSVDAIAVASGPGSFTGLRIGSATAKGLGLALDKPLVEVPTLEGLAYNLYGVTDLICPLIDARRNQVYTGIYEFAAEDVGDAGGAEGVTRCALRVLRPQAAVDISIILEEINRMSAGHPGRGVIFLGDGVPVYRETILDRMKIPFRFAPASCNRQRAGSIAALGAMYYAEGRTVSAADHRPEYLRQSQAERELNAGEKGHDPHTGAQAGQSRAGAQAGESQADESRAGKQI
ncbi:MAG: tRNA (adenosine(37)-N6)-threonylcarbamoyltransferase complex dimerization subunit type 1 TsaB [Clostridium sp.]|nr:tRNA (adenosine(37)-N6)-threonylcarbamoyltransferase complex dimerization subunit type 1 TsaB [Acetatifactor muris]MCM1526334.1 tRNA (adenosine(37)-N6)-threonylcarbamoyltransferase complex dimerization subunit type 1 TsaB [Bacteroides sp.]MCM1562849.1 tRNA (adenosine(37)-N6)-threonylcarbamoyltransferase complex dimerization subunit type 1 TsaB [Clostridium sp.]